MNAVGDVIDPSTGQVVAGVRTPDGRNLADVRTLLRSGALQRARPFENSTLGVVGTNARLTKVQVSQIAQMAHDGYARAIAPVHTPRNGDTIFSLATGTWAGEVNMLTIGALAADVVAAPIVRAARMATSIPGYPAAPRPSHQLVSEPPSHAAPDVLGSACARGSVGRPASGAARAISFVAGRRLGPVLLFSTLLAANLGAGSTVGAAGLGYKDGISAWWWVGSAGLGSLALAFWIGPRIRRHAARHDLRTVGDFLEYRYGRGVRVVIAVLLWFGTLTILSGQFIAIGFVLNVVAGIPPALGSFIGGIVMTIYFTAGGLLTAAWVNVVQLVVLLTGIVMALLLALAKAGRLE